MNIKIADRLVELRKKNGYSQEQLAEKLGLSRQAVSKWERAEASPDTDNLICLAKLYGVSLDDILSTDESVEDIAKETREKLDEDSKEAKEKKDEVHITAKNGIHIVDKDGTEVHIDVHGINVKEKSADDDDDDNLNTVENKKDVLSGIFYGCSLFLTVIAYILLGTFVKGGWADYWPLFILFPVLPSIYTAIKEKKFAAFLYPLAVTGAYCFVGMFTGMWHPFWFLFLTIPVYYMIADPIDKTIKNK